MYLVYGGDATLAIHAKAVLLPERTFSIQVNLAIMSTRLSQALMKHALESTEKMESGQDHGGLRTTLH